MKKISYNILTALLLFCTMELSAQNGATTVSGMNPVGSSGNAKVVGPGDQPLDGNQQLGPAFQASECGLDYTTASNKLGQRLHLGCCPSTDGVPQPATFTIAGIPSSATILKAFIWCDASGNGVPITLNITNPGSSTFGIPMSNVGGDIDKCWGYGGVYTYRADITAAIGGPSNGNGNYVISGFPTNPPNAGNDVDGATMMVIWQDNSAGFRGDLVIWDGAIVKLGQPASQTINNFTACQGNISKARAFSCYGDLQGYNSGIILNGMAPISVSEDWWNYVEAPTTVTPGQNTAVFGNNQSSGDCYNLCMAGLYWRSDCQTCFFPCDAQADFTWDGCNPVNFHGNNLAPAPVISWVWQFGDGGTSSLQSPTHTYAAPGIYHVCLTIVAKGSNGETCCSQFCKDIDVCPTQPCEVNANFNEYTLPKNPYLAYFTDATTYGGGSICNYIIDYGDGSPVYMGPSLPPSHLYPGPGLFKVCYTVVVCVYGADGQVIQTCESTICKNVYIGEGPPPNDARMATPGNTSGISVFPSPTSTVLNIVVGDADQIGEVYIVDARGQQLVKAAPSGKNMYQANVSELAAGVYFVEVHGPDGSVRKERFIKE